MIECGHYVKYYKSNTIVAKNTVHFLREIIADRKIPEFLFIRWKSFRCSIFFFFIRQKVSLFFKKFVDSYYKFSREEALRESTVKLPKSNAGELRFCRKKSSSHNCACVKWNNVVRWNHRVRVARAALHCDLGIFCTLVSSRTIEEIRNVLCFQISNTSD